MERDHNLECRHYVSYTGVALPLQLISPLQGEDVDKRITYFRGYYDGQSRLVAVEKVVYGEIEFEHHYTYHDDGRLKSAELREPDEEPRLMQFD